MTSLGYNVDELKKQKREIKQEQFFQDIPLHENLPREEFMPKPEPVLLEEIWMAEQPA